LYDIHIIDITPVMSTVQHSGTTEGSPGAGGAREQGSRLHPHQDVTWDIFKMVEK
jgi:hypothetical protein